MTKLPKIMLVAAAIAFAGCEQQKPAAAPPVADAAKAQATADAAAKAKALADAEAKEKAALEAGVQAVVYGLPLVIMDLTKRASTNVPGPQPNAHAPVNQFGNAQKYPPASDHTVVRMNIDTLYSWAWLDLSKEPMVLSVPDTHGRYYMMPMVDAWTDIFASPGTRTTGNKAGNYAVTGPGWKGTLPNGVKEIKATTNTVWIIGRTQTNGPKDYAAVNALQKQYKITPLSAFGKPYTPPPGVVDPNVEMNIGPVDQLAKMDSTTFFKTLTRLLAANPPPAADAPALAMLAKIGVVPGQDFDPGKLDPAVAKGLEKSVQVALEKLQAAAKTAGKPVNGWNIVPMTIGKFGTDYGLRAVVALVGLGANLAEDAIYPNAFVDGDGQPLSGAHRYVVHFDKGQTPPANAFWSLTMYDANSFMVENPINRYDIASWMPLKYNKDGSLDVYIQKDSPGKDKEANWLPAAAGDFSVTMRVYWPKPAMLDGTWKPTPIRRVD
jgi:hypothetical protein